MSPDPRLRGVRCWPVRGFPKYRIYYRPTGDGIEVLRVIHSARDQEALLAAEGAAHLP